MTTGGGFGKPFGKTQLHGFSQLSTLVASTLGPFSVWTLTISPPDPLAGFYAGSVDALGAPVLPPPLGPPTPGGGGGGFNMQASPPGFQPPLTSQQGGIFTGIPIDNPTPAAP